MNEVRKIIKFGKNSYVITLPHSWIEKNHLKKGREITISENQDSLVLSLKKFSNEKRVKINLDDKPLKLFNKELISYYLKNYNIIEINGKNLLDKIEQIKRFQEKLSSVEIVEITDERIILKDLISFNELNFNKILNEMINMTKMLFKQIFINDGEKMEIQKHYLISQLDSNINKLTFLAYKSINYNLENIFDIYEMRNSIYNWRIISSLEHVGDIVKRVARYMREAKQNELHYIYETFFQVQKYFEFMTSLINPEIRLEKNVILSLDKKQSVLREVEKLRNEIKNNVNLFLVISQLFKDIIGQLDNILLSVIDRD